MLTPDQISRAKRIWATDLDGCPRSQQHRIMGSERAPRHFVSERGTALHMIAENLINKAERAFDLKSLKYQDEILDSLTDEISSLMKWMKETKIDLSKAEAEVKYEIDLGDGYIIIRKIDILTPTHIIDLKSGRFNGRVSKAVKYEMALSHDAVEKAGEGRRECVVVYLGGEGDSYKEVSVFSDTNELIDAILQSYNKASEVIELRKKIMLGATLPCYTSQLCQYCDYRWCPGI